MLAFLKEDRLYIFPSTPSNLKSGAEAPMARVLYSSAGVSLRTLKPHRSKRLSKETLDNFITYYLMNFEIYNFLEIGTCFIPSLSLLHRWRVLQTFPLCADERDHE